MNHVLRYNRLLRRNGNKTVLFPFSFVQSVRWLLWEKLFILRPARCLGSRTAIANRQSFVCLMNGEIKTANANKVRYFILVIFEVPDNHGREPCFTTQHYFRWPRISRYFMEPWTFTFSSCPQTRFKISRIFTFQFSEIHFHIQDVYEIGDHILDSYFMDQNKEKIS